jgi:pimeloyl-ACP methyl ester carboxylesterase
VGLFKQKSELLSNNKLKQIKSIARSPSTARVFCGGHGLGADKRANRKLTDYGRRAMKSRQAMQALAGVLLCGVGLWLALPTAYRERTYIFNAEGCRLETMIVEKHVGSGQGSVLLFHGISANKKIMSYLARGFAEQGLRVYVPDLPGHGRTAGPFSPARAEQCGEALLRELLSRGMISADRTILAGHSMGGAIAERIAARVPVGGLIAISPAPMRAEHGLTAEKLLFTDPPDLPPNSLVMVGELEPESMRWSASDSVVTRSDGTTIYLVIYGATHVSILFNSIAMRSAQGTTAHVLNLPRPTALPSHRPLIGALGGFVGILLIAGPFLREASGKNRNEEVASTGAVISMPRLFLEFAAGSVLIVLLLRFWIPLRAIRLFQGDYLASVVLLFGALLVVTHWSSVRVAITNSSRHLLAAGFAGIVLLLLCTAWFDLTFYEAWLTAAKWARFPFLMIAFFPYLVAEETLLGPVRQRKMGRRLALALTLRVITWGAMMGGVFLLHSGEILVGLLAGYLGLFNIAQRRGMDIVRTGTGSAAATALFGAILQAGFCLVIFPLT